MREKTFREKLLWVLAPDGLWVSDEESEADQILTLLREEIEKVEEPEIPMEKASTAVRQYIRQLYDYYQVGNLPMQPYEELVRVSGIIQADMEIAIYRGAFYAFRQKVLALLEKE